MENTELVFTRIRAKGEPEFFDPQTDLRKILPDVCKLATAFIQDTTDDRDKQEAFLYMHRCLVVFQIKLAEDKTSITELLPEFLEKIHKVKPEYVSEWWASCMALLFGLYACFYRRDANVDLQGKKESMDIAQCGTIFGKLSESTKALVLKELQFNEPSNINSRGVMVCETTGQLFNNIKDIAQLFIGHRGADHSWNALASACDAEFMHQQENLGTVEAVALALAYPTYEHEGLSIHVTEEEEVEDESEGETAKTQQAE